VRIVTNLLDVPAETIAVLDERRWTIEIFVQFCERVLGCRPQRSCGPGLRIDRSSQRQAEACRSLHESVPIRVLGRQAPPTSPARNRTHSTGRETFLPPATPSPAAAEQSPHGWPADPLAGLTDVAGETAGQVLRSSPPPTDRPEFIMRITYACPACGTTVTHDHVETLQRLACPACQATLPIPGDAVAGSESGGAGPFRLRRCLVCPSTEFFRRKDFPQRLGVGIVVAGLAASCVAWGMRELVATFAILFGTALLDVVLYFVVPECLTCYRCAARYSGDGVVESFGSFNLETHEKHRQSSARIRRLSTGDAGGPPAV
jgi:hypothetical protein